MKNVLVNESRNMPGQAARPAAPYKYRAYGLAIASDWELPELAQAQFDTPDVQFRLVPTRRDFPPPDAPAQSTFADGEACLLWPQIGAFRVIEGRTVEIEPAPDVHPGLVGFALLGPVFGYLLQARGVLALHGSALDVNGAGVAFLGDKGAGKSTTAGAFVRAGHQLLTDDVLAVDQNDQNHPQILPAFPQVKLSQESSSALRLTQARLRRPVPIVVNKERYRLTSGFSDQPRRAHTFYLLKRGEALHIERLDHGTRFRAFLRFAYSMRFGPQAMTPSAASRHVAHCAALANTSSVAVLTVPHDLQQLDRIVEFVERDVSESRASA